MNTVYFVSDTYKESEGLMINVSNCSLEFRNFFGITVGS
jgi:hypothetical protein